MFTVIVVKGSYMTAPGEDVEVCSVKETADPATPLTTELLQIQVEMKHFQQDTKQLWSDPPSFLVIICIS